MRIRDYVTGRVLAWAIIAILATLLGMGRAHAGTPPTPGCATGAACDQGQAYSAASAYPQPYCSSIADADHLAPFVPFAIIGPTDLAPATVAFNIKWQCHFNNQYGQQSTSQFQATFYYHACVSPQVFDTTSHTCKLPCSAQPTDHHWDGLEAQSTYCQGGCKYIASVLSGGTPAGPSCTDNTSPCTSGYVKISSGDFNGACAPDRDGDGISDGNDAAPDDPNNGQDGSVPPPPPTPPPGCGTAGHPACPPPTPPGDESDNTASGGGTCNSAPSCSGDGIACAILFQNWKGRCAAEQTAANTSTASAGSGLGPKLDAIKTATTGLGDKLDGIKTAIENQGSGGTGPCGTGDPSCAGTAGTGLDPYTNGEADSVSDVAANFKTQMQNAPIISAATGFLTFSASGSCPVWTVPGTDYYDTMTFDYFCDPQFSSILDFAGWLVLAVAAFAAFKIAVY